MSLPTSKNPLITKWIEIFSILKKYDTITDQQINNISKSTGITISALYEAFGLTNASGLPDNSSLKLFDDNGPLLIKQTKNVGGNDVVYYDINPNYNQRIEQLLSDHNLSTAAHPNGFDHDLDLHNNRLLKTSSIEMNPVANSDNGGFIDFHFGGVDNDYTARIVENTSGNLKLHRDVEVAQDLNVDRNTSIVGTLVIDSNNTAMNVQNSILQNAKDIKNMFAGATLPDGTKLDEYVTTGIFRITNGIGITKPAIDNCAGFLQVMDVDHDDDTTAMKNKRRVRQIIYPDNVDDSTPYTRVGSLDTLEGTILWSEWSQMGGGSLRRIVVNGTSTSQTISTESNPKIQNNVMYESFGANTFILPAAANVPVGTRIGVEQYVGEAHIRLTGSSTIDQVITPTSVGSGTEPTSYIFECTLQQDGSTREWILDAEHNHGAVLTEINSRIATITEDFEAMNKNLSGYVDEESDIQSAQVARPMRYIAADSQTITLSYQASTEAITQLTASNIKNYIGRSYLWRSGTSGTFARTYITKTHTGYIKTTDKIEKANDATNLYFNDVHVVCTTTVSTITLPSAPSIDGIRVIIELPFSSSSVTVKTLSGQTVVDSEAFTANAASGIAAGQYMTLQFEYLNNGWRLLSLA